MKLDNYETIKKSQWQEIATQFGVVYQEDNVVRYLVEKIAEKIGVDDKIVSDRELKRKVVEKINSLEEVVSQEPIVEEPIVEEPVAEEPIVEEPVTEEPVTEEPVAEELPQLTRMEQLRLECESYGVAWAENHTEANLEQVLNGVKSAGVQPIKDVPTFSAPVEKELDVTQAFEITSENVDEVSSLIDVSKLNNPAYNPLAVEQKPIVNGGYNNSNTYLDIFKNMYLNAIKNHWRVLSYNEISEMILRDKQTFTFEINFHPSQSNKVEIILKQDNNSVRIPSSDTNDWLEING